MIQSPFQPFYKETDMKRFVIERNLPGVGALNREQLKVAAETSNGALAKLAGRVQWIHSYVVDDKTFCIYVAENEHLVREHAQLSGFPANKITEVRSIIDPTTANPLC
jgi:Nickel responsive protein SCO4226-like